MKLVAISDTHGHHDSLTVPDGDVLIHAGDFTKHGTLAELDAFNTWLDTLPHTHKIVVAGNHEHALDSEERSQAEAHLDAAHYLQDDTVTLDGVTFHGSPWLPTPFLSPLRSTAFTRPEQAVREKYTEIPDDTDVLITHCPPRGIADRLRFLHNHTGCDPLRNTVDRVQPQYHVFGHVHEGYGRYERGETTFLNAAMSYIPLLGGTITRLRNDPLTAEV